MDEEDLFQTAHKIIKSSVKEEYNWVRNLRKEKKMSRKS